MQLTPGVRLECNADGQGQRYVTPAAAVLQRGADIVIVGRGVLQQQDRLAALLQYKEQAYQAYTDRLQCNM